MPSIVHSKLSKKGTVTILVGHQKPSLFPAYDLREKELRNVSVLFRLFELVPTLARDIFGEIGVNVGKTELLLLSLLFTFESIVVPLPPFIRNLRVNFFAF